MYITICLNQEILLVEVITSIYSMYGKGVPIFKKNKKQPNKGIKIYIY